MNESSGGTREQILLAAKAEFLEKGFQYASLRNIVKTAGVTTGALYGYYDSKEALFDALVRESYEYAMGRFQEALSTFAALPIERQPESLGQVSGDCMQEMLLYMHEHRDTFHLLLLHSDGTRYATMVDELVAREVDATHRYYTVLAQLVRPCPTWTRRWSICWSRACSTPILRSLSTTCRWTRRTAILRKCMTFTRQAG